MAVRQTSDSTKAKGKKIQSTKSGTISVKTVTVRKTQSCKKAALKAA